MRMINLLEETIKILASHNKTLEDIKWFGTGDEEFEGSLVNLLNINYDCGYGSAEVLPDLLLVGDNFWLERQEYDGSEWWEYKTMPTKPGKIKQVSTLVDLYKDYDYED